MNDTAPVSTRTKNRRLLALLLSVIAGLVIVSVVLVAFVFPRRHGRIPRNAREAVLGVPQPPVESSAASAPSSAVASAPGSAASSAPTEPTR